MSLKCCQTVAGLSTFWRVATAPMRLSAKGIMTWRATLGDQIVSESTSATRGVVAASQPRRSASRLPGVEVMMTVTGRVAAMAWQRPSVSSMTQMTSSTSLASHESSAWRKIAGSSS